MNYNKFGIIIANLSENLRFNEDPRENLLELIEVYEDLCALEEKKEKKQLRIRTKENKELHLK